MLFQKKNPSVGALGFLKSKHKDSTPVVSQILAQRGQHGKCDTDVSPQNNIVLKGIDTLHLTAGGMIAPSRWLIEKQQVWREYQSSFDFATDEHLSDEINGEWFSIKPYGMRQYAFILYNPEVAHIRVWNVDKWSSGATASQQIFIDFASTWLKKYTPDQLKVEVRKLLSVFFDIQNIDDLNIQVSRGDLFCDITNGSTFLSESQIKNTITRSKYRNYFVEDDTIQLSNEEIKMLEGAPYYNKGTQKLIPTQLVEKLMKIVDTQVSIGADNIVHKREIETAYFSKKTSDVWSKCYDKTKCCKVKNDLDTPLLWSENGWNGNDTIVRTEFSMRRAFIKELDKGSYVKLDDFIDNMDKIWEWMTTKWMRMVSEIKKNNIQTSPISSFWSKVQSAFRTGINNIIRKRNYNGKINQLFKQALGCLSQAGAMGMNNEDDIYFINSLGDAVIKGLSSFYHSGDLDTRRMKLGLA